MVKYNTGYSENFNRIWIFLFWFYLAGGRTSHLPFTCCWHSGLLINLLNRFFQRNYILRFLFISGRSVGLYVLSQKSNFGQIHFVDIVAVMIKWLEPLGFHQTTRNLVFLPPPLFNIPKATSLDPQNISSCIFPRSQYNIIFHKDKKWSCSFPEIVQKNSNVWIFVLGG